VYAEPAVGGRDHDAEPDLTVGVGLVWVPANNELVAIDPGTNSIVRTFDKQVASGVFAAGHPWVDDAHDSLLELDPKTGAPCCG
jgi:hypothetical protein